MKKNKKSIPNFSDQTFKLMEIDGKEEILVQDFHSDEWNDGKEEFGVKKINQLTSLVDDLTKKVKELEEIKDNLYYEGEYKWMPTTVTNMPKGWLKVKVYSSLTLIEGFNEGKTKGEAIRTTIVTYYQDDYNQPKEHEHFSFGVKKDKNYQFTFDTVEGINQDNFQNYAAGIYANLWQYDPSGKFSFTRELAIKIQESYQSNAFDNDFNELKQEFENNIISLDSVQIEMLKGMLSDPDKYFENKQ